MNEYFLQHLWIPFCKTINPNLVKGFFFFITTNEAEKLTTDNFANVNQIATGKPLLMLTGS